MKDHYVIIDTDAGTDDALAIWLALRAHQDPESEIKVVGIVCVNGNTTVDNVVINVSRILRAADSSDIPIFRGATTPIVQPFVHQVDPFHGENGFGDMDSVLEPIEPKIEEENGISAIIRLAHKYKCKISLLALGPLTDLALAVRLDPTIHDCFKSIHAMGGNIEGEGNATISAEFNFAIDPEAAFITLDSYTCPITIVPWEVCRRAATTHDWRTQVLGKISSPQTTLLNKIEEKILEKYTDIWIPCDQLAAAALVEPKVILESKCMHCTVELHGHHTRGLLLLDHMDLHKKRSNVTLVRKLDESLHLALLLWAVGSDVKPF